MNQPLLSILICALNERAGMLATLLKSIEIQINKEDAIGKVEILVEMDNRRITTGEKRNNLLKKAAGKWICFVDDDDELTDEYIPEILKALESDCDVVGFKGWMTTDKQNSIDWRISKDLPYCAAREEGRQVYLRFNNHLSVLKREIALQIMFLHITQGEDYDYAVRLKNSGLIKTETYIDKFLYHYKFISQKP